MSDAGMDITLEVDMIHRARGIAILSDGQEVPIVQWIAAGNETSDPHEATACVCGPDFDGHWYAVNLASFTGKVH